VTRQWILPVGASCLKLNDARRHEAPFWYDFVLALYKFFLTIQEKQDLLLLTESLTRIKTRLKLVPACPSAAGIQAQ